MRKLSHYLRQAGSRAGLLPYWVLPYRWSGKTNKGYCTVCASPTVFVKKADWLRDFYVCARCHSIPRHRALIKVLNSFYPDWRELDMHESSPGGASSRYLARQCKRYSFSQYFLDVKPGDAKDGVRCENLEKMTFPDNHFDLLITQDVFEHVMHPAAAFKEIERVLKPGGAHVFTMPWYPKLKKTVQRARVSATGGIEFLQEPVYHKNPISVEGSLVTYDWGLDFPDLIYQSSGLCTTIYLEKDPAFGLEAEFLEVFISRKVNE